jgi:hypothetical protein
VVTRAAGARTNVAARQGNGGKQPNAAADDRNAVRRGIRLLPDHEACTWPVRRSSNAAAVVRMNMRVNGVVADGVERSSQVKSSQAERGIDTHSVMCVRTRACDAAPPRPEQPVADV